MDMRTFQCLECKRFSESREDELRCPHCWSAVREVESQFAPVPIELEKEECDDHN